MSTKENTLYLPIKQVYFDEIIAVTKKKEFREMKPTTFKKYLETERVEGESCFVYDTELISEEDIEKYPNQPLIYNGGVYAYIPKPYEYLNVVVGYNKDRETMVVEVEDITFETLKNADGSDIRFNANGDDAIDGDFALWQVVYHLGAIVETDLKKDR